MIAVRSAVVLFFALTLLAAPVRAQTNAVEQGDIIVTEILYSSDAADTDREYVEVYNRTDRSINLENWRLIGEDPSVAEPRDDVIDKSLTLDAGEFAVLCENSDSSENGGVQCDFDYVNSINHENTADIVVLQDADGDEIDRVEYNEDSGWPDAVGASLEYVAGPGDSNNKSANWEAATARTGDFADTDGSDYGSPNTDAPEGALPVEFAAFDANRSRNRAVLTWTTGSETGNAGFEIQHRRSRSHTWQNRGFVSGNGTTDEPHSYRYKTESLGPGVHAFRLKQVDVGGAVHFSGTRKVDVPAIGGLTIRGPNPVRSGRSLSVTVDSGIQADEITLYNVLGQRVRTIPLDSNGGRDGRIELSTRTLSSGSYFLRVLRGGPELTGRFTVVK